MPVLGFELAEHRSFHRVGEWQIVEMKQEVSLQVERRHQMCRNPHGSAEVWQVPSSPTQLKLVIPACCWVPEEVEDYLVLVHSRLRWCDRPLLDHPPG